MPFSIIAHAYIYLLLLFSRLKKTYETAEKDAVLIFPVNATTIFHEYHYMFVLGVITFKHLRSIQFNSIHREGFGADIQRLHMMIVHFTVTNKSRKPASKTRKICFQ